MILSDLVDFVCTTINQTGADDKAACKMYFKLRHKMLWQLALWKDSLVSYTKTITSQGYDVTSSEWLPTRQVLMVNPVIGHVVALRTADRKLSVQSQELFYCRDIDSFQNEGMPVDYILLRPAVWDFDTAQSLAIWDVNNADDNAPAIVSTVGSDGITETTTNAVLATTGASIGDSFTILTASKNGTTGQVQIGQQTTPPFSFMVEWKSDSFTLRVAINSTDINDVIASIGAGASAVIEAVVGDVLHFWVDFDLSANTYTVAAAGTLQVSTGVTFVFTATPSSLSPIITLAAADTVATKRQRLQLIGSIADNTVLRILGKRLCPDLANDNDEPAIQGSEMCLIPAVHADMLKRERQYGKAITMATQEFGPMLETLKAEQTAQQAHKKRFVPTDGFSGGNSYPFMDGSPLSF